MIRRYAPMKSSMGTPIPAELRLAVYRRDGGCIGRKCFDGPCGGTLEVDHVRASHGMGMKSRTELDNLVALCGTHHRYKTEHGREARPILLAYLAAFDDEHTHVDPQPGCTKCFEVFG
jgi:5-methylcytosine-specific restriction endonuclease McrA